MAKVKKEPLIMTLDTETYNGLIGGLKRIAIYYGQEVEYGYTFADLEPTIINLSLFYDVHIYIHNAEFDIRKINELFNGDRIIWKNSLFINGKVTKLQCKHYIIHDSFKLLPSSLKELSGKKGFNVEHGKLDLWTEVQKQYPNQYKDHVDYLNRCDVDDQLFLEYLGYDVISLYEVLQTVINLSGLTVSEFVKCVSTASLSRYLFKHGYKGKAFKHDGMRKTDYQMLCSYNWKKSLRIEEFIRAAYCGGRVEVFIPRLDVHAYYNDVNSLYPYVMAMLKEYPIGEPTFCDSPEYAREVYETWKEDKKGLGFVNAYVFIPDQKIPPLPVKMGKLCFPCGHVYGTWSYEELEHAEKHCGVVIKEFYAVCHFEKTFPVFENFIGEFYKIKEQATIDGNIALRTLAKLIQNVGYGYTGMRRDDKTTLDDYKNLEKRLEKNESIVNIDDELGFIEVAADVDAEYIQVQIAAYVTSRARLVWLKAARDVLKKGGNVYYGDTDSMITDIPLDLSIVDKTKLGYWDVECEPLKGLFLRPKVYALVVEDDDAEKSKVKFKGVSKDTQKNLDFDFYEMLMDNLKNPQSEYVYVERNKTLLRSILYMKKNHLSAEYYETRDKKMNLLTVEKRQVDYNKNNSRAWFFNTLDEFENFRFSKPHGNVVFKMGEKDQ